MNKLTVLSAFDEKLIQELSYMSDDDLSKMIENSYGLFQDKQNRLSKAKRIAILEKTAINLEQDKYDFVKLIAIEGGKPFSDAELEIDKAVNCIKMAVHHISTRELSSIPMGLTPATENRTALSVEEPKGLAFGISAFNHPVNNIVHQIIPAFAAGCPIVIKPSLKTPLSCLKFAELLFKSGVPQSYCQVAICKDTQIEKLISNPRFSFVSFIGAAEVGWNLKNKIGNGIDYVLEHGGSAPLIIDKDVDIKKIASSLLKAAFYHAGQVCVSAQRLYIPEELLEIFKQDFLPEVQKLNVGDPLLKETDVGPLISYLAVERIDNWINKARQSGAEILTGGKRLTRTCYEPTIIINPSKDTEVSCKEVFGPVLCVYTYKTFNDAIAKANSLNFSFQSSIFSNDINNCLHAAHQLEASTVMINDHSAFRADWMPFGGYKDSGFGMSGIGSFIDRHYRKKLMILKSDSIPKY